MSPRKLCLTKTELKEWRTLCMQARAVVGTLQDDALNDAFDLMRVISDKMHSLTSRESMRYAIHCLHEEDET